MRSNDGKSVKLLYVSPERWAKDRTFRQLLRNLHSIGRLNMFAVDEAHLVMLWGENLRPAYKALAELATEFPQVPCVFVTASANRDSMARIGSLLGLGNCPVLVGDLHRVELQWEVQARKRDVNAQVEDLLAQRWQDVPTLNRGALVYIRSRVAVEAMALFLSTRGLRVACYHAGMTLEQRNAAHGKFIAGDVDTMVATDAYGLGVDVPHVWLAVLVSFPLTLIAAMQTGGRCGRDGRRAVVIMLHGKGDVKKADVFLNEALRDSTDTNTTELVEITRSELRRVDLFMRNGVACRARMLINLGNALTTLEKLEGCRCDNCRANPDARLVDATDDYLALCRIVLELRKAKGN